MTWELTADVVPSGPPEGVARAVVSWFGPRTQRVYVRARGGDTYDAPTTFEASFDGVPDPAQVAALMASHAHPDQLVELWITLAEAPDNLHHPSPKVYLYGDRLLGVGRRRGRAPVLVTFGNRNAWRGRARGVDGEAFTDADVRDALLNLCATARPHAVSLHCEEEADLAFNLHFVYRDAPDGFLRDLRDVAQIALRGGQGAFNDGRSTYEPIVSTPDTMLLAKRTGAYRESFVRFLDTKLRRLDALGLPESLPHDLVEHAILATESSAFQGVGDGFAVWNEPLMSGYTDLLYLELVERLLAERAA